MASPISVAASPVTSDKRMAGQRPFQDQRDINAPWSWPEMGRNTGDIVAQSPAATGNTSKLIKTIGAAAIGLRLVLLILIHHNVFASLVLSYSSN